MIFTPREEILRDLHPLAQKAFRGAVVDLQRAYEQGRTDRDIRPVYGFRTPREQQAALDQRPVVEHRGPWKSPHSYGLAVKFQPIRTGGGQFQMKPMSEHDRLIFRATLEQWGLVVDVNDPDVAVHTLWYLSFMPILHRLIA